MRYFDLSDDITASGRWELGTPIDGNGQEIWRWDLVRGEPIQLVSPIRIPVRRPGTPLSYSLADVGTVPVLHVKLAKIFSDLAPHDVQLFPVEIESQPDQYVLLNATRALDCIDEDRSAEVRRWTVEDGIPEKVGQYAAVYGMRIDPSKVGTTKVFRTWGWWTPLIVSEDIKTAIERASAPGACFKEV